MSDDYSTNMPGPYTSSSKRNSSIEVLRILSMILIVLFHIIGRYKETNVNLVTYPTHVYLTNTILGIWGILGVYLFVAISAWYQNDTPFRVRKVVSVMIVAFSYIVLFSIIRIAQPISNGVSLYAAIKGWCLLWIHDDLMFFNPHWFVAPYVMLNLFSPFLNMIIKCFPKKILSRFIIVFSVLLVYNQLSSSLFNQSVVFVYIYFLIGYLKRFQIKLPKYFILIGIVFAFFLLIFTIINDNICDSGIAVFLNNYTSRLFGNYSGPSLFVSVIAVLLFVAVVTNYSWHNKFINIMGGGTFGIYLFHETYFWPINDGNSQSLTNIIKNLFVEKGWLNYSIAYPLQILVLCFLLFIMGLMVELVRKRALHKNAMTCLNKFLGKTFDKLDNIMNFGIEDIYSP